MKSNASKGFNIIVPQKQQQNNRESAKRQKRSAGGYLFAYERYVFKKANCLQDRLG